LNPLGSKKRASDAAGVVRQLFVQALFPTNKTGFRQKPGSYAHKSNKRPARSADSHSKTHGTEIADMWSLNSENRYGLQRQSH
jgi:hypothetical protein